MTFAVPVPPVTGDELADAATFAAWETAQERHYYPHRFGPAGERLPEPHRFEFFVGVPEPSWLNRADGVPKFVSVNRLDRLKGREERWPVTCVDPWAIDSGAYIALDSGNTSTPWWMPDEIYASKILSFATDSGRPPDFVAPQDWPCELGVRRRTGMTVREHQQATLDSYLFLTEEWPWLPWIPVLQGWDPGEHLEHASMYADAGVDLASCHRVGIGSVCRRAHLPEIVAVIEQFADAGLKLHGFGLKKTALPIVWRLLTSADSMAWSFDARYTPVRMPDCTHAGPDCRNCYRYAKYWHEQTLASLSEEKVVTAKPRTRRPKAATRPDVELLSGLEELFASAATAGTLPLVEVPSCRYVSVTGVPAQWAGAPGGTLTVADMQKQTEVRGYLLHWAPWRDGVRVGRAGKVHGDSVTLVALADQDDLDWSRNHDQVRLVCLAGEARVRLVDEPVEPARREPAKAWMTASLVNRAEGILASVHPGEDVTWAAAVVTYPEAWLIADVINGRGGPLPYSEKICARDIEGWQRPRGYVKRYLDLRCAGDAVRVATELGGEVLAEVTGDGIRALILEVVEQDPQAAETVLVTDRALEEALAADEKSLKLIAGGRMEPGYHRATYQAVRAAYDACFEAADGFWQAAEAVQEQRRQTAAAAVPAGAAVPVVAEVDRRAQQEEARQVIAGYEPGVTAAKLLHWALGVLYLGSPQTLWSMRHATNQMWKPRFSAPLRECLGGGRWVHGAPSWWAVHREVSAGERRLVVEGGWDQVTSLMTVYVVPGELWERLDAVIAELEGAPEGPQRWEIQRQAEQVAAQMWQLAKPVLREPVLRVARAEVRQPRPVLVDAVPAGRVVVDLDAVDVEMQQLELDLGELFGSLGIKSA